jgi:hypothetical protein
MVARNTKTTVLPEIQRIRVVVVTPQFDALAMSLIDWLLAVHGFTPTAEPPGTAAEENRLEVLPEVIWARS